MREFSGGLDGGSMHPSASGDPSFDDLMKRASEDHLVGHDEQRWSLLRHMVSALATDLSLDEVLARTVEAAARLAGGRRAALGVPYEDQADRLRVLVAYDVDRPEEHSPGPRAPAGATTFPEGGGVLSMLLDQHPRHWHEELPGGDGSQRPHGSLPAVPAPRPGRRSPARGLAVPLRLREHVFGTLVVEESLVPQGFNRGDHEVVTALAAAAGIAIDNAHLREEASRRERWLGAAADLGTAILHPEAEEPAPQILADLALQIAGADLAWVATGADADSLRIQAAAGREVDARTLASVDLTSSLERCVAATGRPLTIEDLTHHPRSAEVAQALGADPAKRGVLVPLALPGGRAGVICLAWRRDVDPTQVLHDASLPALLAQRATSALQVAASLRERERTAVVDERDRIARDLHDLVIQHLYAVGLELQSIAIGHDPEEMRQRLERTVDDIEETIRDIRRSIFALGSVHDATDPRKMLHEVVERAGRTMKLHPTLRFRGPVRALVTDELIDDVLAVVTETLTNTNRHAGAQLCAVEVSVVDGISVRVTDDGKGMDGAGVQSGLENLRRRAELRGGHLDVISALGHGTSVVWWVPLPAPPGSAPAPHQGVARQSSQGGGQRT